MIPPRAVGRRLLLAFALCVIWCGCATGSRTPRGPRDDAFITYQPPPEGSHRLRLAVKDLIDMKGEVTSAGSQFLAKHSPPAEQDAECLRIARERGVDFVGKTNLTEFAVGVSGINTYFGTPRNPLGRHRRLIPGGSSSGSAVAVASGLADVAIGTDTAGSIRTPAACCGVAGLKTTFGLISEKGVYPISPNQLDTVGPMARDVHGLVEGMNLLEADFPARFGEAEAWRTRKIHVGRLYLPGTDPRIDRAVDDALRAAHLEIIPLGYDFAKQWEQAQRDGATVAASNAWVYDQRFTHELEVQTLTKAVVALGSFDFHANYQPALLRRQAWKAEVQKILGEVDFIALPTLRKTPPSVPWPFAGSPTFELRVLALQNTSPVNLAGNPALALPIPLADRQVPKTSLQLIGPMRSEAPLLRTGERIEAALASTAH